MTLSRTSSSSDAFSRRVAAAVPEALGLLPASWSPSLRERAARKLVERVLAAADQALMATLAPAEDEEEWHYTSEPAPTRCPFCSKPWGDDPELARLRAVEQAAREMAEVDVAMPGGWEKRAYAFDRLRSALSEPAAGGRRSG